MKSLIFILALALIINSHSHANPGELFSASSLTAALGGQAGPPSDAANHYYAPALIARATEAQASFSLFHVQHQLTEIANVLIRNTQNATRTVTAAIPTNYENLNYGAFHLILPLDTPLDLKLGVSALAPIDKLLEVHTGDPFLTEYVMYRARGHRGVFHGSLAGHFTPQLSWSLGFHVGVKLRSHAFSQANIDGPATESSHSYARAAAEASPLLAPIASVAWHQKHSALALTFQREIKNQVSFHIEGGVQDPGLAFDMTMDTLAYYDPHILRLSHHTQLGRWGLYGSLEYQLWQNYQTPVIRISKNTGNINPSLNFEQISPRNILLPKLGLSTRYSDHHTGLWGLAYRPTPLKGDFSGPGNSVDVDKVVLSAGHQWQTPFFHRNLALTFSLQYHHLFARTVVKASGTMENGEEGEKIGSPRYPLGGHLWGASLGLTLSL